MSGKKKQPGSPQGGRRPTGGDPGKSLRQRGAGGRALTAADLISRAKAGRPSHLTSGCGGAVAQDEVGGSEKRRDRAGA